jgi:hypothetical protein
MMLNVGICVCQALTRVDNLINPLKYHHLNAREELPQVSMKVYYCQS